MSENQFENRAHGAILVDGIEVGSTVRCCHCGGHFLSLKGSGVRRGFCMRCMARTCGAPECDRCIPLERQLEMMEKQKLLLAGR